MQLLSTTKPVTNAYGGPIGDSSSEIFGAEKAGRRNQRDLICGIRGSKVIADDADMSPPPLHKE